MRALTLLTMAAGVLAAPMVLSPRQDGGNVCRMTWGGASVTGVNIGNSCRYTVRYGTAERWAYSTAATSQAGQNGAEVPPKCPQTHSLDGALDPHQSEDCLFAVVYTPLGVASTAKLPVFVWIHGGSYISGSASDSGMDGTVLAPGGNVITIFIQYRLGVLGFLPPSNAPTNNDPNFAIRDAILALQVIRSNIGAAGGDPTKVTVGGQSSGASLTRTLLGAPAAKGLYRGMILQSDTMNHGTQLASHRDGLQAMVYGDAAILNCTTFACFKGIPIETILSIQAAVNTKAAVNITGIPLGETFRPQADTTTIPNDPLNLLMNRPSGLSVDITKVPILITTVRNETGGTVQGVFSNPMPAIQSYYEMALKTLFNVDRAKIVVDSGLYPMSTATDGLRISLERVATEGAFRCVNREIARRYAAAGGKIWVGEWVAGVPYLFGQGYCTKPGVVCHADDLLPTFGNAPTQDISAQTVSLQSQVRTSWVSFIANGTPAPAGITWPQWTATSAEPDVHVLGDGAPSSCPVNFWGVQVKWDFQMYSNTTSSTSTTVITDKDDFDLVCWIRTWWRSSSSRWRQRHD